MHYYVTLNKNISLNHNILYDYKYIDMNPI